MSDGAPVRIAMLAPISWRVPPRHYGPWEQFVSLLTEGLVARGVDVSLFATADSITSARLVATAPTGYSEDPTLDAKVEEARHIAAVFERAGEFDLIHNSFDFLPLSYSRVVDTPVVTTIHGFGSDVTLPVYTDHADHVAYVAISDADRHPALPYVATVHHGIDLAAFDLVTERRRPVARLTGRDVVLVLDRLRAEGRIGLPPVGPRPRAEDFPRILAEGNVSDFVIAEREHRRPRRSP